MTRRVALLILGILVSALRGCGPQPVMVPLGEVFELHLGERVQIEGTDMRLRLGSEDVLISCSVTVYMGERRVVASMDVSVSTGDITTCRPVGETGMPVGGYIIRYVIGPDSIPCEPPYEFLVTELP